MSKKQIHTNLVGETVRLTEEVVEWPRWHTNKGPIWRYDDPKDDSTAKFVGDYCNIPGGKNATAEIVAVHLHSDLGVVATIMWNADGTMLADMKVEYLQIIQESDGDDDEPDWDDEPEHPKEPVEGWYIESMYAEEYGTDLIRLVARMCHTNIDDDKEIEETLDPGIGDIKEIRAEEYGGVGKIQKSIVVTAEGHGDRGAEVQVEIDYKTGEFKDESLNGWEQSDG